MRTSTGCRPVARRNTCPTDVPRWIVPVGIVVGILLGLLTADVLIVRV